jgi:hypothetical protein
MLLRYGAHARVSSRLESTLELARKTRNDKIISHIEKAISNRQIVSVE